jgi:hypothetical protein
MKVFLKMCRLAFMDVSKDQNAFTFRIRTDQKHPLDMPSSSASSILLGIREILKMTALKHLKFRRLFSSPNGVTSMKT